MVTDEDGFNKFLIDIADESDLDIEYGQKVTEIE